MSNFSFLGPSECAVLGTTNESTTHTRSCSNPSTATPGEGPRGSRSILNLEFMQPNTTCTRCQSALPLILESMQPNTLKRKNSGDCPWGHGSILKFWNKQNYMHLLSIKQSRIFVPLDLRIMHRLRWSWSWVLIVAKFFMLILFRFRWRLISILIKFYSWLPKSLLSIK